MIIKGTVIKGKGLGKKLGFPTANLSLNLNLPSGVYYCRVKFDNESRPALAVTGLEQGILEVHILNWSGDLYGREIEVKIKNKIREVIKFKSPDDLKKQIALDVSAMDRFIVGNL